MENKKNNKFDKMQYLRTAVNQFIHKETTENVEKVYHQLIEQLPTNLEPNQTKRRILEICRDIFLIPSFRQTISDAKKRGTPPNELVSIVVNQLSSKVLGRHYNMSKLSSNGMLSNVKTPDGNPKKVVAYKPNEKNAPPKILQDFEGNPLCIQFLGTLGYKTPAVSEYIYKYRISRNLGNNNIITNDVFTEINLSELTPNTEYYNAVIGELLSPENIKYSSAKGYIGELIKTPDPKTRLKPGTEHFEENEQKTKIYNYRYQISQNYALYYDCEKFEAIEAYLQQEQTKQDTER